MGLESYKPPSKKCSRCRYYDSINQSCIIEKSKEDNCRFFFPTT